MTQTTYDLGHGITCIDTLYIRPGLAACYLLEHNGKAAFIDTGTTYTTPRLLELLAEKGLSREDVEYVIPTHVHLDHAGGAGTLIEALPNAKLVIHPRGARHMINPTKLVAGAKAVYGEETFDRFYGELVAVPAERVIEAGDNFKLSLNGRELLFIDTPGHAKHHFCIYDALSKGIFSGDTFGLSYREFDSAEGPFIFPPTTPVQFDPIAWHHSLDKLMALGPKRIYLTHFCMVENPQPLVTQLRARIDEYTALAKAANKETLYENIVEALTHSMLTQLKNQQSPTTEKEALNILEIDIDLNAQGLQTWLLNSQKN
jgi:glyoxylase-like metal-dependent hydrolase (beta-lactamase superfamily II)